MDAKPERRSAGSIFLRLLTSPPLVARTARDRWDWISIALSCAIGLWYLAFKLQAFYGLGTTSDLYHHVEISRSWLIGRPYADNEFGDFLMAHVCLIPIPLGLLAYPFGAPGLLFAICVAAALSCWGATRVLRSLDVPGPAAVAGGVALVIMPSSAIFFYHPVWGYAIEIFCVPMALGLLQGLLKRSWVQSLVFVALLLSIKEEMPLLILAISTVVILDQLLSERSPLSRRINRQALACMAIALIAVPIFFFIIQSHPRAGGSLGSFERMPLAKKEGVAGGGGLVGFVLSNLPRWLASEQVRSFPKYVTFVSLGLALLRPHLILIGAPLTIVSWLMQDQILWPVRFATTTAFAWCLFVLGLSSISRLVKEARSRPAAVAPVAVVLALAAFFAFEQAKLLPQSLEVYRLSPWSNYTPDEVRDADALFKTYRDEGRFEEPVIASVFLFRYAHDRDLYWSWALKGKPRPVWILWDTGEGRDTHVFEGRLPEKPGDPGEPPELKREDYEVIGRRGRFALYKRISGH